jgi:hypothetical protein
MPEMSGLKKTHRDEALEEALRPAFPASVPIVRRLECVPQHRRLKIEITDAPVRAP